MNDGNVTSLSCLNYYCEGKPDLEFVQSILSEDDFGKYQRLLFLSELREEKNCRWCPNVTCNAHVIADPEGEDFPKLTCQECDTEYCFHCCLKWHPDISCKRAKKNNMTKAELKADNRTEKWKKKHGLQTCGKCNLEIQKDSG